MPEEFAPATPSCQNIAERGEAIYGEKYRANLERSSIGKFIARRSASSPVSANVASAFATLMAMIFRSRIFKVRTVFFTVDRFAAFMRCFGKKELQGQTLQASGLLLPSHHTTSYDCGRSRKRPRKSTGLKTRHYNCVPMPALGLGADLRPTGEDGGGEAAAGVNSPRTTHHSGLMAATMSRSILLTAFS